MRKSSTERMIGLASFEKGPLAKLVSGCIEVGIVVPSQLRAALKKAGYTITYHTGPGEDAPEGSHPHGAWLLIRGEDKTIEPMPGVVADVSVVARAYSENEADALLQAVYAWLKEEAGITDESIIKV